MMNINYNYYTMAIIHCIIIMYLFLVMVTATFKQTHNVLYVHTMPVLALSIMIVVFVTFNIMPKINFYNYNIHELCGGRAEK